MTKTRYRKLKKYFKQRKKVCKIKEIYWWQMCLDILKEEYLNEKKQAEQKVQSRI